MSSISKKLVSGSALGIVEIFSTIVVTLTMTPFIIRSLGDTMYGFWIFAASFLGYYGLMDLGLSSAIQRFVSRAIGEGDKDTEIKVFNTSLALFAVIGFIALIISFIIAFFLPLVIKNIPDPALFRNIILILGIDCAIGFPLRVFSGILGANLRYDISISVELIKLALRTVFIIIFLNLGYGILALAFIMFATDISGYIAKYFMVKRLYKHLVISPKLIDTSMIKPLFGYSAYTFIAQIGDELRFNIDNLVITAFIGLSAVTLYSIAARIVKYFMLLVGRAMWLLIPVFSQYEAKGDYDSIREKFIFTTKISIYLSILIAGIIIIFGKAFIETWVGERFLRAYPILIVLVISVTADLIQSPSYQLLYGISKHKFLAVSNSMEGIANLVLSLILVREYGLMGVALGTAVPMIIIRLFVQPIYISRAISLGIKRYCFGVLLSAILNSSAVLIVFWFIIKSFISGGYFNLAVLITATVVFFTVCILFFGFQKPERNYFKKVTFGEIL